MVLSSAAHAQTFVEAGGGWNYLGAPPAGDSYTRGFNLRASIGRVLAPGIRLRMDAEWVRFDDREQYYPPCAYPGCTHPYYNTRAAGVAALTANGVLDLDPRGVLYVSAGAGLFDVLTSGNDVHPGVSLGAGVTVPVGSRLHAFVEARWHALLGAVDGPAWVLPVTLGFRY